MCAQRGQERMYREALTRARTHTLSHTHTHTHTLSHTQTRIDNHLIIERVRTEEASAAQHHVRLRRQRTLPVIRLPVV